MASDAPKIEIKEKEKAPSDWPVKDYNPREDSGPVRPEDAPPASAE